MLEYQKNMKRLLEHPMWKGPQLSAGKKDKTSKVRKVDNEVNALEVHASRHIEDMCNKDDHTARLSTPLELFHEGKDTSTYDGQFASTSGHEEKVASSPCDEVYGGLGVSTPKCVEALALDELPLGNDIISQEVCMTED